MTLNLEGSAEAIVPKYGTPEPGRAKPKGREEPMRSNGRPRKQPTSYEGLRQRAAVNPQRYAGAPNLSTAQIAPSSREVQDGLLETILEGDNLRLALKPVKRKFLGFSYLPDAKATIRLAPKTLERVKEQIREATNRTRSVSMETRIAELNRYLIGWIGYFHIASAKTHCMRLDEWIRRRLRICACGNSGRDRKHD